MQEDDEGNIQLLKVLNANVGIVTHLLRLVSPLNVHFTDLNNRF